MNSLMKSNKAKFRCLCLLMLLSQEACVSNMGTILMSSQASKPLFSPQVRLLSEARTEGTYCQHRFFFIPLNGSEIVERAWSAALAKTPGAEALMDVMVEERPLYFILYNNYCASVSGIPVAFK